MKTAKCVLRSKLAVVLTVSVWTPGFAAASFNDVTEANLLFEGIAQYYTGDGSRIVEGRLGSGRFRYSPSPFEGSYEGTGAVVDPDGPDRLEITAEQQLRLVEDIEISILGLDFGPGYAGAGSGTQEFLRDYFWHVPDDAGSRGPAENGAKPMAVMDYGPVNEVEKIGEWRFGFSRETFLLLEEDGRFLLAHPFATEASESFYASGTWTATAVPEPLTVVASLLAIGFGVVFRRLRA